MDLRDPSAPAYLRLMGLPSTPENNGLTVDRNGSVDSTSALNKYLEALTIHSDLGYLGPGSFKTSGELVATGGASLALQGAGPTKTIIHTQDSAYHGLRIALAGSSFGDTGFVRDIGIHGPAPHPTGGKAGLILDGSILFRVQGVQVSNFDIGFDFINNCYNSSLRDCTTPRFGTVNVGVYLREGDQSGSDMVFSNCNLDAYQHAVCIKGGGGGYTFVGGQWSTENRALADAHGVIQLGWDYIANAEFDGAYGVEFYGVGFEGWHGRHAIRSYGQNVCRFRDLHFNATAKAAGEQALGILKATHIKNGKFIFDGCEIAGAYKNAALATLEGYYGSPIVEGPWFFGELTANGAGVNPATASLMEQSGINVGTGVCSSPSPGYLFGTTRVRMNPSPTVGNVLQYSTDRGASWKPV